MRSRVSLEQLREDRELFARTCLKIQTKKGGELSPLVYNHSQRQVEKAIAECRAKGRPAYIIELKARQTGLSTHAESVLFHDCWARPNRNAAIIAHRRESAQLIFNMCRRFYENLPESVAPAKKKFFTKNQIEFLNGSRIQVDVEGEGAGRGITAQDVHLSEFAFYKDPHTTLTGVLNAVADIPDATVILESTPFGLNEFYDLWIGAKAGHNDFIPVFVPWFHERRYRMAAHFHVADLDEEEAKLRQAHGLTLEQLAWRRWTIRNKCHNDVRIFHQEYPSNDIECFLASGRPVFEPSAIEFYNSGVPPIAPAAACRRGDIVYNHDKKIPDLIDWEAGPLRVYHPPNPRHRYIVGADPSEGDAGSDPSPLVVTDQMTLEPVAIWYGRKRPDLLAETGFALACWYNNALGIWEANNHGLTYQVAYERFTSHFYMREVTPESVAKKVADKPGYMTTQKSKHFLVDVGRRAINDRLVRIVDPILVSQISTFYYDEKNKPDHQPGKESDVLIAYLLTLEAHRGDPSADLVPLTVEESQDIVREMRRVQLAHSMGIEAELNIDRTRITAEDLERLDEMSYKAEEQRARLGVGEPT